MKKTAFIIFLSVLSFRTVFGQVQKTDTTSYVKFWVMEYTDSDSTWLYGQVLTLDTLSNDETLKPLENVLIQLKNRTTGEIFNMTTNFSGRYHIGILNYDFPKTGSDSLSTGFSIFDILITHISYCPIILLDYEPKGDALTELEIVLIKGNNTRVYNVKETLGGYYKK